MVGLALIKFMMAAAKLSVSLFHFPQIDEGVFVHVDQLATYIGNNAVNLVYFLLPDGIIRTLMVVIIAVYAAYWLYLFVMWVLKKIPVISVS